MIIPILLILAGFALLWFGSDFVVDSAKKLSEKLKISQVFVGLTIVSIGTSLPEIATSVMSAIDTLKGIPASGIGVGMNIGSCVGQITFVVGLVAYACVLKTNKRNLLRDGVIILLSALTLFIMGMNGSISKTEGIILLIMYASYLFLISVEEKNCRKERMELKEELKEADVMELKPKGIRHHPVMVALFMLLGLALLAGGSFLVVKNALKLTDALHLTQTFVGVVIVGIGGFLPELSTAIKGIIQKSNEISLGVLIGSNITDPLFALGLGAAISGFNFSRKLLMFDIMFWSASVLMVMLMLRKNMRIEKHEKKQGVIMIGLYFFFILMNFVFFRAA